MPSKPTQVVLVHYGDGILNGLVPVFARVLDDQLSASSAFGSVLSERSFRDDVLRFNQRRGYQPIDKVLIDKYLKYLSRQEHSPSCITLILPSIRWYVNRIHDLLLDDATLLSLMPP